MVKSREPELAVGAAEAGAFEAAGAFDAGAVSEPPPHAASAKVPIIIARRVMFILITFHKLSVCLMHSYLRSVALQEVSCKPMFLGTSITASCHTTGLPHSLEAKPAPCVAASNIKQTELPKTQCDCVCVLPLSMLVRLVSTQQPTFGHALVQTPKVDGFSILWRLAQNC